MLTNAKLNNPLVYV